MTPWAEPEADVLVQPSFTVTVAVTLETPLIGHVPCEPPPPAHPPQEKVTGSPSGSLALTVKVAEQLGWHEPGEALTEALGAAFVPFTDTCPVAEAPFESVTVTEAV